MDESDRGVRRRTVLRGVAGLGGVGLTALAGAGDLPAGDPAEIRATVEATDPHTVETFAAAVDAVIPRTPGLADEAGLGDAHVPGGVDAGVHEYFVTYVNALFEWGLPGLGHVGNLRLAEAVAVVLDAGATELLARGQNQHPPGSYEPEGETWTAGGPFARLHPTDRIRALALFDEAEKEFDTASLPGPVLELDAGIVGQLVVAFPEVIYYSEWEGYDDLTAPPSERTFDPGNVQSWAQTDFPGFRDGYAAHRGYLSGAILGGDTVWRTASGDPPDEDWSLTFTEQSGDFADNDDYDPTDHRGHIPRPVGPPDQARDGRGGDGGTGGPPDAGPDDRPDARDGGIDVDLDIDLGLGLGRDPGGET